MSSLELSNELIKLSPKIKFIGISTNGITELIYNENEEKLDENLLKLGFLQTPHILEAGNRLRELGNLKYMVFEYDKIKLFNLSTNERTINIGANKDMDNDEIIKKVYQKINLGNQRSDNKSSTEIPINRKYEQTHISKDTNEIPFIKDLFSKPWQNVILSWIDLWREFTTASIQINEKLIKEFWKGYFK